MTDKTFELVKAQLYKQDRIPINHSIDSMHLIELANGKRAKRTLDKKRTNQDYYKMKTIQTPLLDHYENVDWYERDYTHDFASYVERK